MDFESYTGEFAIHLAMKYVKATMGDYATLEGEATLFPGVLGGLTKLTSVLYQIVQIASHVKVSYLIYSLF
jgi:hypothetical protein